MSDKPPVENPEFSEDDTEEKQSSNTAQTLDYTFQGQSIALDVIKSEAFRLNASRFIARIDPDQTLEALETDVKLGVGEAIGEYTRNVHAAIMWYQRKAKSRRGWRTWYAFLSIALMGAIPVITYQWMTNIADGPNAGQVLASATAGLTGIIGIYRGVSAWTSRLLEASNFQSAAANLKSELYAFERKWTGKAATWADGDEHSSLNGEFLDALKLGVDSAKAIAQKQRDDYYANTAPPNLDVLAIVKAASTDAQSMLKTSLSPDLKAAIDKQSGMKKLQTNLETHQVKAQALYALIAVRQAEIAVTRDAGRKTALEAQVTQLQKDLAAAERGVVETSAQLESMLK